MEYKEQSIKFDLPNGHVVDLLYPQLNEMIKYKQDHYDSPESCGFILGYQNASTNNITISEITTPQKQDFRSRFFCTLRDAFHFHVLRAGMEKHRNYYIGVWHTHPQSIPEPSSIDMSEWAETIKKDKSGADYFFFIIIGTREFRVWVGDKETSRISEVFETEQSNGLYLRG